MQRNKGGSRNTSEEPWLVIQVRDDGGWDKEVILEMVRSK